MESRPEVSIILATRDGGKFLAGAVRSVLAQTYKDWELIIVDDGSLVPVRDCLPGISDARIKHVSLEDAHGLTKALNIGIGQARGNYIARIDDDDLWIDQEKLDKQVEYMKSRPKAGVFGTQFVVINEIGNEVEKGVVETDDGKIRMKMMHSNQFAHSSVLIRRGAMDEAGGYDETVIYAQDYELWLRIGRKWTLGNLPDVCVAKRVHTGAVTNRRRVRQTASFVRSAWRNRQYYPGFYGKIPVYVRELLINLLLPKSVFYRLSRMRRVFAAWLHIPG